MANYYVWSGGSNTPPYNTWAKAATVPLDAITAASFAPGNTVFQHAETFTVGVDTTYNLAFGLRWICTNDLANQPPTVLSTAGVIDGSGASGVDIYITNGGTLGGFIYGLKFKAGAGTASIVGASTTSDDSLVFENCGFELAGTSGSSTITFGSSSVTQKSEVTLKNCSTKFSVVTQGISIGGRIIFEDGVYPDPSGSVPNTLFEIVGRPFKFMATGVDFSGQISGVHFAEPTSVPCTIILSQCTLGAGTLNAAITVAGSEYYLYDCSSSDTHYQFANYNYRGSTTISTSIYANDGAEYNLTGDKTSWVVAGNANTSTAAPYVSPWFSVYNEVTAPITPYLEVLRDGSTTAYTDIQVWAEFSAKTTSSSSKASIGSDFGGHLSAGTAQDTGAATWVGATTPWIGKLQSPSITPSEIGHIQARVIVAGDYAVYVDPQIRGL